MYHLYVLVVILPGAAAVVVGRALLGGAGPAGHDTAAVQGLEDLGNVASLWPEGGAAVSGHADDEALFSAAWSHARRSLIQESASPGRAAPVPTVAPAAAAAAAAAEFAKVAVAKVTAEFAKAPAPPAYAAPVPMAAPAAAVAAAAAELAKAPASPVYAAAMPMVAPAAAVATAAAELAKVAGWNETVAMNLTVAKGHAEAEGLTRNTTMLQSGQRLQHAAHAKRAQAWPPPHGYHHHIHHSMFISVLLLLLVVSMSGTFYLVGCMTLKPEWSSTAWGMPKRDLDVAKGILDAAEGEFDQLPESQLPAGGVWVPRKTTIVRTPDGRIVPAVQAEGLSTLPPLATPRVRLASPERAKAGGSLTRPPPAQPRVRIASPQRVKAWGARGSSALHASGASRSPHRRLTFSPSVGASTDSSCAPSNSSCSPFPPPRRLRHSAPHSS
uniref:Uncharacterized protein n=1 Tax=Alexandrium monilatum TaxID=311494 RepID=A0A7S4Q4W5_9DINO